MDTKLNTHMTRPLFLTHLTLGLGFLLPGATHAQDLAARGRDVFSKNRTAVVTVQLVVKTKLGFQGFGGDAQESKQEVTGTVIDPSGLTAVSLSSTDPTSLMQSFMGGFGGDGEEGAKMKFNSEVSDVKLLCNDGAELAAEIVLRDKDLDLAFVRPKSKPAAPLPALDLSGGAKVDVLDEIIAVNRLGKVAGRAHSASVERINAIVQKPRLFYVPGSDKSMTGLGCPAFNLEGKIVGLFVMRSLKSSGGGGMGMFNFQSPPVTSIILPAEDVKKIAAQAPAAKEEQK
jgi:S1-C subfamily serine protease